MDSLEDRQEHLSFDAVYDTYYDRIYKYVFTLLLNKEDAEDVTADTFLAAFRSYSSYDPSKASIRTWLTRIAHNRAINLVRSAAYTKAKALPEPLEFASDPADFTGNVEDSVLVMRLYAKLLPEERELLNMRYVMELKYKEIGDLLGVPERTVSKRIQRLVA